MISLYECGKQVCQPPVSWLERTRGIAIMVELARQLCAGRVEVGDLRRLRDAALADAGLAAKARPFAHKRPAGAPASEDAEDVEAGKETEAGIAAEARASEVGGPPHLGRGPPFFRRPRSGGPGGRRPRRSIPCSSALP